MFDFLQLRAIDHPWSFVSRSGVTIRVEDWWDATTLWAIYCAREYDVRKDDRVVVDLGANIGVFATYAASAAQQCRVHSYEPFPSTFIRLNENVHRNTLAHRVICYEEAVFASTGFAMMDSADRASVTRALSDAPLHSDSIAVRTIGLEEVLERCNTGHIDLLKIDIEGSEAAVLEAASDVALGRIGRICVEIHRAADQLPIYRRLESVGFTATRKRGHGEEQTVTFERPHRDA
ncbi:MAG: FkbM family methyltransferase [Lacipirellulaceae bacterium]